MTCEVFEVFMKYLKKIMCFNNLIITFYCTWENIRVFYYFLRSLNYCNKKPERKLRQKSVALRVTFALHQNKCHF